MKNFTLLVFLAWSMNILPGRSDGALPGPAAVSLAAFRSDHPPFAFKYDDKESDSFIAKWNRHEEELSSDGGALHRFTWTDPKTKLKVTADVRSFTDYSALEWVMYFENQNTVDTPIIEEIKPLHWNNLLPGGDHMIHYSRGSTSVAADFEPVNESCEGGYHIESVMSSSYKNLPFFNLQSGDYGVIGAIGWSCNWAADFTPNSDHSSMGIISGMPKTHLRLHAGEKIRTPRILLLPWHGDIADSQNLWRRLALAYYSPRHPDGSLVKVPICWGSWGGESIDKKFATLAALQKLRPGVEVYWVDAGWFGDSTKDWSDNIGNWDPSPVFYPHGLAPLGEATKKAGLDLLLWMAPEEAPPSSALYRQHPDWFYSKLQWGKTALVKLGQPDVLQGMTDLVYNTLHTAGATWFRQDGGASFVEQWDADDKPDRIGMNEIQYITNFYAFWDALRSRISDLQIDNCFSGGKRIDLETMSRSVSLWRSDAMTHPFDISMEPSQAQGLIPWVPLSGGVWSFDKNLPPDDPKQLYNLRSSYCAGLDIGGDLVPDMLKPSLEEYKKVQPYFYGDFYPLSGYSLEFDAWTLWQLDRPDLKSGVVLMLRRQESPFVTVKLCLHGIDPAAQYEVEIRRGLSKDVPKQMTGKQLLNTEVSIPDAPGSALVFYKKI
jgi:alpha-galactosidase